MSFVCSIDVGTGSVRAAVFNAAGVMLGRGEHEITLRRAPGEQALYRIAEIWHALTRAVRSAIETAAVDPHDIKGLAIDATCSLVLRDRAGAPLALDEGGEDTLAWCDHRAVVEARACSATGAPFLAHLGGSVSPERQIPKLLWVKRHRPDLWARLGHAMDLADDLTMRATGNQRVSLCTMSTKWPYLPGQGGWQHEYLAALDLVELSRVFQGYGEPVPVGSAIGGLCRQAAEELGLAPGIAVSAGMVDAYAAALGTSGFADRDAPEHVTMVTGTSNCVMFSGAKPRFVSGIWGPFRDAALPGQWYREGGQTAGGGALEAVLDWFKDALPPEGRHDFVQQLIAEGLQREGYDFGRTIHVLPDFCGNRSPFADPGLRASLHGIPIARDAETCARVYWRVALSLGLGLRQIIEVAGGAQTAVVTGGLSRNPLMVQMLADTTGLTLLRPKTDESVLLGAAMAASVAAGIHGSLNAAAQAMTGEATTFAPDLGRKQAVSRDYAAFLLMQQHRAELAEITSP